MSLYKRIFLENDPAYEEVRREWGQQADRHIEEFPFRLKGKRRNHFPGGAYWDPAWSSSIDTAAKELGVETIQVNEGVHFRTAEDLKAVQARAEEIWAKRIDEWKTRLGSNARPK